MNPKLARNLKSQIQNQKWLSAFHCVNRFRIVLVADLISWLALAFAHIKTVGTVNYHAGNITYILISVNDSARYQYRFRIIVPNDDSHNPIESIRVWPVVPHAELEM